MKEFKHKNTGEKMKVNETHSVYDVLKKSKTWVEVKTKKAEEDQTETETDSKDK